MDFVLLSNAEYKKPSFVNLYHVVFFEPIEQNPTGAKTRLILSTGKSLNVEESPEEVEEIIRKACAPTELVTISGPEPEIYLKNLDRMETALQESLSKISEDLSPRKSRKQKAPPPLVSQS